MSEPQNYNDRLTPTNNSPTMKAIVTMGNGDYDQLHYRDVPVPKPGKGNVLIQVLSAGINNTEINTRLGWYSSKVTASTNTLTGTDTEKSAAADEGDGGWNDATPFPFIQGTDCCGRVVVAGDGADQHLIGKRVIVRSCMRKYGWDSLENIWMASDFDGAFAQFVSVPASEVFAVDTDWSDAELGVIPCAWGTSENMLHRAAVRTGQRVLIAGASGGVGSASIQLAKRRGAEVIAIAGRDKMSELLAYGADQCIPRDENILDHIAEKSIDVVVDNVGGSGFPAMLKALKRGGKLVTSGAIAGPIVDLDMRDMYLKDITLIGCTAWDEPVFPNLVGYIERKEIAPLVAQSFDLKDIVKAQQAFTLKHHIGKFVLIPPNADAIAASLTA